MQEQPVTEVAACGEGGGVLGREGMGAVAGRNDRVLATREHHEDGEVGGRGEDRELEGRERFGGEAACDVPAFRIVAERRAEQHGDQAGAGGDDGLVEAFAAGGAAASPADQGLAGLRQAGKVQSDIEAGIAEDEDAAHAPLR